MFFFLILILKVTNNPPADQLYHVSPHYLHKYGRKTNRQFTQICFFLFFFIFKRSAKKRHSASKTRGCFKTLNITTQRGGGNAGWPRGGWSASPPSKSRRIFFLWSLKKLLEVKRGRGGRGGQTGGDGERRKNLLSRFVFVFLLAPPRRTFSESHTPDKPLAVLRGVCACECLSRW